MSITESYILIIDDEEGIRESFNLILGSKYSVKLAGSADAGYALIKTNPPKLIFLDIKMPEVNGIEALKEIKKISPSTPVIIVTGYQSVEAAKEVVALGAADYIVKPFDTEDILKAAAKFL